MRAADKKYKGEESEKMNDLVIRERSKPWSTIIFSISVRDDYGTMDTD